MDMEIKTIEDVKKFFQYLSGERKVIFHPDDDFEQYVNMETLERTFTPEECDKFNVMMQKCFEVCEAEGEDIYLVGIETLIMYI